MTTVNADMLAGRKTVLTLTNKSGGSVIAGDVVVLDSSNDEAFTTSTAGAVTVGVGVAQESIANNASGRVLVEGYASLVNVNASVTRGHFGKTYTVAKQATDAGASRVVGVFCQFLTGGTTPSALLLGMPDGSTGSAGSPGTPALTLSTTNSTGVAATLIATDATIAAFDATVPTSMVTGAAAAAGSAGVAARRDHTHGALVLAEMAYKKGSDGSIGTTSSATLGDVDATNAKITFTAPASGHVLITACFLAGAGTGGGAYFGLRESTSQVGTLRYGGSMFDNRTGQLMVTWDVTGVSAGAHTYKLAFKSSSGTVAVDVYGGPTFGDLTMKVEDAG